MLRLQAQHYFSHFEHAHYDAVFNYIITYFSDNALHFALQCFCLNILLTQFLQNLSCSLCTSCNNIVHSHHFVKQQTSVIIKWLQEVIVLC